MSYPRFLRKREELKVITAGEKIKVSVADKNSPLPEKNKPPENDYTSGRKLSQAEIDVLVKQLLAEKNRAA